MKIFLDTANLSEIKEAVSWGIVDGVTTNPSLMAKESGLSFDQMASQICKIVPGPVSLEVVSLEADRMVKEARQLAKIAPNAVIKVPMTIEGVKAVKALGKEKIKCNVTLVFSANQALLAAKAGAAYISPFLGRLDDIGQTGMDLLTEIIQIVKNYQFSSQVLASSIRHTQMVKQAALLGCHVATIPYAVLKQMYAHVLTDIGLNKFLKDWEKVKK